MDAENFNQKCDRILRYLLSKPSPYQETLSCEKFTAETGITNTDHEIVYLHKEKKYINLTQTSISINELGVAFIVNNSFSAKKQEEDLKLEQLVFDVGKLRRDFSDYGITKKRAKNAMRISIAAIVVTIVLQVIQWKCNMPH